MTTPDEITPEAEAQLRKAVATALSQPGKAQGFLSSVPDLSAVGGVKDKVIGGIDGILEAINTILQYKWLVPDKYEAPLQAFAEALTKVKSWVD